MILLVPVKNNAPQWNENLRYALRETWKRFNNKNVRLIFKDEESVRSIPQNRYLWGVVYTTIAAETGHTTEEVHEFCRLKFLPREYMMLGNQEQEIRKSTTLLSTAEFANYIEQITAFAGSELGITIPPPQYVE